MNVVNVASSMELEASGPSYSVPALHAAMIAQGAWSRLAVTGKLGQNRQDEVTCFPGWDFHTGWAGRRRCIGGSGAPPRRAKPT